MTYHRQTFQGDYALYRGDDFITCGTVEQIAKEMGIEVRTIKRYSYASHLKRNPNGLNLIKIEED